MRIQTYLMILFVIVSASTAMADTTRSAAEIRRSQPVSISVAGVSAELVQMLQPDWAWGQVRYAITDMDKVLQFVANTQTAALENEMLPYPNVLTPAEYLGVISNLRSALAQCIEQYNSQRQRVASLSFATDQYEACQRDARERSGTSLLLTAQISARGGRALLDGPRMTRREVDAHPLIIEVRTLADQMIQRELQHAEQLSALSLERYYFPQAMRQNPVYVQLRRGACGLQGTSANESCVRARIIEISRQSILFEQIRR